MTHGSPHEQANQVLYRHTKRPRWGLAVLAWDHVEKRGYQFEDGKLRVFKRGFYRLLEEVDPPADQTQRVLKQLGRAVVRREAARGSSNRVMIPFAEQIALFKELFPGGFTGPAWREKMRGGGADKRLKRHRDPAVKLAAGIVQLLDSQRYDDVVNRLLEVLEQTNLVTAAKLKPLRAAPLRHRAAVAAALRGLIHGEEPFAKRFEELVHSLGEPSWELATAPLALLDPERQVCVKSSVFKQQALWMAPRLELTRPPTAESYQRLLKMAQEVARQLEQAGLPPRDLLDVHDFIYLTLKPSARKQLVKRIGGRSRLEPAPESSPDQEAA